MSALSICAKYISFDCDLSGRGQIAGQAHASPDSDRLAQIASGLQSGARADSGYSGQIVKFIITNAKGSIPECTENVGVAIRRVVYVMTSEA